MANFHASEEPREVRKINLGIRGKRILVVEDNYGDAYLAKLWLSRLGCEVVLASDGGEAMHEYRLGAFDIIFMDLDMPKINGFEATQMIREHESITNLGRTQIIALSGNLDLDTVNFCEQADMDDYIAKPVSPSALTAAMGLAAETVQVARRTSVG